ncbi:MAG: glycoside hydrolase family 38 C-terminal domain-containing protein [Actinomycetota bacterium]
MTTTKPVIHMIGNAHIDVVWLWRYPEGLQEVKATFRSALDRMLEYPDFRFTASSAAHYEWVERNDPSMFREIQERVAEGRWEIAGGWWVEPDCNIPGGEALVRQGLLGQRYFLERFGRMASVGFNVDSFGHAGSLPQILRKSGIEFYVFMRPAPDEKTLPSPLFWWEADEGSRVLAYRIPYQYCTGSSAAHLESHLESCMKELGTDLDEVMCFYGVGNHGGGPTRANIEAIQALAAGADYPAVLFSTTERFFRGVDARKLPLPTVHDELQHHARGCYANHSGVKQWNRRAESLLVTAEKAITIAERVAGHRGGNGLAQAWKDVLLNQFHDVLAGTAIEEAYEDARDTHGEAMAIAGRGLTDAVQAVAGRVGVEHREDSVPLFAFNPHAWPSRVELELDFINFASFHAPSHIEDEDGNRIELQLVTSRSAVYLTWCFSFIAELPPLGYRVYRLVLGEYRTAALSQGSPLVETDRWRLEFDAKTGLIASLVDRRGNCEVFSGPAGEAIVIDDPTDTWGHGPTRFDEEIGRFQLRSIQRVEDGPVRSVVRVTSEYGTSVLCQDFIVYRDLDPIEVRVWLDWREQHRVLKLRWPVCLDSARATYEIPYGFQERPVDGEEEPGQRWVDVTGAHLRTGEVYGLSLLNDGKYSFDVRGSNLHMTVVRSPVYAHHDPYPLDPLENRFMDQGIQRFTYALLPHAGTWREAGTVRRAIEMNERAVALLDAGHAGDLPRVASFVEVTPENVVVTALKQAEDASGDTVVRCHETAGMSTRASIRLTAWDRVIDAELGPSEIKTYRIPAADSEAVYEVDLLERP